MSRPLSVAPPGCLSSVVGLALVMLSFHPPIFPWTLSSSPWFPVVWDGTAMPSFRPLDLVFALTQNSVEQKIAQWWLGVFSPIEAFFRAFHIWGPVYSRHKRLEANTAIWSSDYWDWCFGGSIFLSLPQSVEENEKGDVIIVKPFFSFVISLKSVFG